MTRKLFIFLALIFCTSCGPIAQKAALEKDVPSNTLLDAGTEQWDATRCEAVRHAVGFLAVQYDAAFHLLRESPITAPDVHWLTTDNALAFAALKAAAPCAPDAVNLAAKIAQGLAVHEPAAHGLIELLVGGESVAWPPRTANQTELATGIWREERLTGAVMNDWREYADLSYYGVLCLAQEGRTDEARALYVEALEAFDGAGFADKANGGGQPYATYKLALAIIAADALGELPDDAMLTALLDKQEAASGGFFALYNGDGGLNDANVETTAYSILALMTPTDVPGSAVVCTAHARASRANWCMLGFTCSYTCRKI